MPPLATHQLCGNSRNTLLSSSNNNNNNHSGAALSSSFRTKMNDNKDKLTTTIAATATTTVSFNPKVRVIETVLLKNNSSSSSSSSIASNSCSSNKKYYYQPIPSKTNTWYSDTEIDKFQSQVATTIRRFQTKKLTRDDCLRGLECQTTRCSASCLRIALIKDLILQKQQGRLLHGGKVEQMIQVVTSASAEEALVIARQDAREAHMHQREEDTFEERPCMFLLQWFLPKKHHKMSNNLLLV